MNNSLFGTDGIRGTVGTSPFTLYELEKLGRACALWAREKYGHTPTILLGHDTRISCSLVKSAFKSGFLQFPVIIVDTGVLPTPAICQLVSLKPEFDCGIVISASHNPYQDNGIKIINGTSGKLLEKDEHQITHLFKTLDDVHDYASLGTEIAQTSLQNVYINQITSSFQKDFLAQKSVVLDCAHGAMTNIAPKVFEYFGATVTTIHNQPNGININRSCGAVYPQSLQEEVVKRNADFGFAFDGDGDRVIAVNCYGQIKNGDDILAILMQHPHYSYSQGVVGTIMSNKGLEDFVTSLGKTFLRTPVGDKYVAQTLQQYNYMLGGEASGHIIIRDYLPMGDGLYTALKIIETALITNNTTLNTFNRMPQILVNVPLRIKHDLKNQPLSEMISQAEFALPHGRLIARYSGTEPLLRIMVEDPDFEHAQAIAQQLAENIKKVVS